LAHSISDKWSQVNYVALDYPLLFMYVCSRIRYLLVCSY